jgi:CDP-paratose 2-epimerase
LFFAIKAFGRVNVIHNSSVIRHFLVERLWQTGLYKRAADYASGHTSFDLALTDTAGVLSTGRRRLTKLRVEPIEFRVRKLLVTGSSGLIGSEVVTFFSGIGWEVHGVDNNMRADFFGPQGDTSWNTQRLKKGNPNFHHHQLDIRHRAALVDIVQEVKPDAIVHTAAQPSHDLAASRPYDDFDVNAVGTLNVLEAARRSSPETPFVHMSTNKVYGDAPNRLNLVEKESRWDYADPEYANGIKETFSIDHSMHSLFGASKVAADVLVQEYGRYFQMPTCCLRGGCLTGPNHSGVELHGFLSYLIRCNLEGRTYRVFGYKGKQVRDNIHSYDVAHFMNRFIAEPRVGEVYNLGGGRENSVSILEAFALIEKISGKVMQYEYVDQNRKGDHICYISDLTKMRSHYPGWDITKDLTATFVEIYEAWIRRV